MSFRFANHRDSRREMGAKRRLLAGAAVLIFCAPLALSAQKEFVPSPAAKAAFDKARKAGGNWKTGAELYRKAFELDPDYYEAHEYYILFSQNAAGTSEDAKAKAARLKVYHRLEVQYRGWAKQHPKDPVYLWALGILHDYLAPDEAIRNYHQALAVDPHYAPAYDMLAVMEESRGELAMSREDYRKAHEAWPGNADIWGDYIAAVSYADPGQAGRMAEQMAARFPDRGVGILGYVAMRDPDAPRAQKLEETIWKKFPVQPDSDGWMLDPLFNTYVKSDPAEALVLSRDMVKLYPKSDTWPELVKYAQAVMDAGALVAKGQASRALPALDKLKLPRYGIDRDTLDITRARVLAAAGRGQEAYTGLVDGYAKDPSEALRSALFATGMKLGKTEQQVGADVWARRSAEAKPGIPFSVVSFTTGKRASLADYKGKVFLLNFFYPLCGPCRGEFPFLQSALEKYKSRGFEILAVNTLPTQKDMVMPLLKGWGLGFVPLEGNPAVIKAYRAEANPANFLYGADGRIYNDNGAPFPIGTPSGERTLDLEIEALLQHAKAPRSP